MAFNPVDFIAEADNKGALALANRFSVSIGSPIVNFKLNLDESASKSCKGKPSEV